MVNARFQGESRAALLVGLGVSSWLGERHNGLPAGSVREVTVTWCARIAAGAPRRVGRGRRRSRMRGTLARAWRRMLSWTKIFAGIGALVQRNGGIVAMYCRKTVFCEDMSRRKLEAGAGYYCGCVLSKISA